MTSIFTFPPTEEGFNAWLRIIGQLMFYQREYQSGCNGHYWIKC